MCFRPAGVDQFIECSSCGKQINMVMGVAPEECPFCGAKTDSMERRNGSPVAAPAAPGAPGIPGAPKPPAAPGMLN